MTGHGNRSSCWELFWQVGILPLESEYIYYVIYLNNKNSLVTNYDTHNLQARQSNNLYPPISSLTLYQKGVYYTGIKWFNKLPSELKELVLSPKLFKSSLRRYLVSDCFYELDEFYFVTD
jgi:hypothetical protein